MKANILVALAGAAMLVSGIALASVDGKAILDSYLAHRAFASQLGRIAQYAMSPKGQSGAPAQPRWGSYVIVRRNGYAAITYRGLHPSACRGVSRILHGFQAVHGIKVNWKIPGHCHQGATNTVVALVHERH